MQRLDSSLDDDEDAFVDAVLQPTMRHPVDRVRSSIHVDDILLHPPTDLHANSRR